MTAFTCSSSRARHARLSPTRCRAGARPRRCRSSLGRAGARRAVPVLAGCRMRTPGTRARLISPGPGQGTCEKALSLLLMHLCAFLRMGLCQWHGSMSVAMVVSRVTDNDKAVSAMCQALAHDNRSSITWILQELCRVIL